MRSMQVATTQTWASIPHKTMVLDDKSSNFFSISGTIMVNLVFETGDGQPAFASSLFKGSTVDPKP